MEVVFFRGDISVICLIIVLKLTATVCASVHFLTYDRNDLFFRFSFKFDL